MKTAETLRLEKMIYKKVTNRSVFGCFEVTIGWYGSERVDFITCNTKSEIRCYEIKISKNDFYSKNKNSFLGDYNYYVMPFELYEIVKDDIPDGIGVYVRQGGEISALKKAKKQGNVDRENLKAYMIRSLFREEKKHKDSQDKELLTRLKNRVAKLESDARQAHSNYISLQHKVIDKFGMDGYRKLRD